MELNNLQKLVHDISGYKGAENGARDDGYFNLKYSNEKIKYLKEYVKNVADYEVSYDEIRAVYEFLELDLENPNENTRYKEFINIYK